MRLLFFTPGFAADEDDSTCIPPLQLLVRELLRKGADIHIVALEYPFRAEPYRWHSATVYPCNGQNRGWLKMRTIWRAMTRAHEVLSEEKTDFVHSFWLGMAADVADSMAEKFQVPHFTTLMGQDATAANTSYLKKLAPDDAPMLIALSQFHNEAFAKNTGFAAGHVIPWGMPDAEIPASLPTGRPVDVLGVGSFLEVKNWERWLRVVQLAAAEKPDLNAVLVGEGPLFKEILLSAKAKGLGDVVSFTGGLPRPMVLAKMQEARTLLHTSNFESFGFVLVEALANGCRVLATPVGIAPELPEIFTSDDDPTLAQALLERLQQPAPNAPAAPLTMRDCGWKYWGLYHSI
ncbi:MAG: glycosyltransferase family 4 protein [Saprospiraceae bacterium]